MSLKNTNNYRSIFLCCLFFAQAAYAQSKNGIENYSTGGKNQSWQYIPMLHFTGKHGVYTELRYNYEEVKTASANIGKNFHGGSKLDYSLTPMIGLVFGRYEGASALLNADLEYGKCYFSAQLQYTLNRTSGENNFFYNWSEVAWQPLDWFYTGVSVQQTKIYRERMVNETGLLIGFQIKKVTIPLYGFSPLTDNRNFILGINVEW